jgi:glycerol-3-phosphate acyltransferase PlsX
MNNMLIAVDAMGGDYAPRIPVEGAVLATRASEVSVILVGDAARLQPELARLQPAPPADRITLLDTPEWIEMGESPGAALRTKKQASVLLAAELVAKGQAQVMVSAGNSGAAVGAAVLRMGTLPGVARPAIATVVPNYANGVIFLDAGATVDCKPEYLLQFARMGAAFARCRLNIANPRIGLLGIGEESTKGNSLTRDAHELLSKSDLNFVGNVEPKEMMQGAVEVAVCDGFVGNIALKLMESFAEFSLRLVAKEAARDEETKTRVTACIESTKEHLDWAEYGGALLLGVKGLCIISHGRSTAAALARAIQVGKEAAEKGVIASLMSVGQ